MAPKLVEQAHNTPLAMMQVQRLRLTRWVGYMLIVQLMNVIDNERKIVTTPAYMYAARIREARAGIQKLVQAVLSLALDLT